MSAQKSCTMHGCMGHCGICSPRSEGRTPEKHEASLPLPPTALQWASVEDVGEAHQLYSRTYDEALRQTKGRINTSEEMALLAVLTWDRARRTAERSEAPQSVSRPPETAPLTFEHVALLMHEAEFLDHTDREKQMLREIAAFISRPPETAGAPTVAEIQNAVRNLKNASAHQSQADADAAEDAVLLLFLRMGTLSAGRWAFSDPWYPKGFAEQLRRAIDNTKGGPVVVDRSLLESVAYFLDSQLTKASSPFVPTFDAEDQAIWQTAVGSEALASGEVGWERGEVLNNGTRGELADLGVSAIELVSKVELYTLRAVQAVLTARASSQPVVPSGTERPGTQFVCSEHGTSGARWCPCAKEVECSE